MTLSVGSTFSGIEGFGAGFERAGMAVRWQVEADERCRELLARRWAGTPVHDDVRTVHGQGWCGDGEGFPGARCERCLPRVDVLCGGFPCQDVSVAGRRAGLAGERSGLFWEFARLAAQLAPRWLVVENVPGLLSSCGCDECGGDGDGARSLDDDGPDDGIAPAARVDHRGRDMAVVVGTLTELGYGVAWRVLDAQYFGLAQRRERVFLVGCLGDPARAASVLLEPESCGGNPAPRRETGAGAAVGTLAGTGPGGGWRIGAGEATAGQLVQTFVPEVAVTLSTANGVTANAGGRRQEDDVNLVADTLRSHPRPGSNSNGALVVAPIGFAWQAGGGTTCSGAFEDDMAPTLPREQTLAVAYPLALRGRGADGGVLEAGEEGVYNALRAGDGGSSRQPLVAYSTKLHNTESNQAGKFYEDYAPSLAADSPPPAVAFAENQRGEVVESDYAHQLATAGGKPGQGYAAVRQGWAVRRLTPTECERLQGFDDDWTDGFPDSTRYRMLGNAVPVAVTAWIGRRIVAADAAPAPVTPSRLEFEREEDGDAS